MRQTCGSRSFPGAASATQAYLTDHLVPSSPACQTAIQHATALLTGQGVRPGEAARGAFGLIAQTVNHQATMLAYIDVLYGYALLAAVLVPVAFLLLRPGEDRAPAGAH